MIYMGSKRRITRHIIEIMESMRESGQAWYEPFVGGGNSIMEASGCRYGSDISSDVIDALISIRDFSDELPKCNTEFTESTYNAVKNGMYYKHRAFAGFAYSFGAKFFNSYARDAERDYIAMAFRKSQRERKKLEGVVLSVCDFFVLKIKDGSLVYCDPPYRSTTGYKCGKFDSDLFFEWARDVGKNNTVFVSELAAPSDFIPIWQKNIKYSVSMIGPKEVTEKLFIYEKNLKTVKFHLIP